MILLNVKKPNRVTVSYKMLQEKTMGKVGRLRYFAYIKV